MDFIQIKIIRIGERVIEVTHRPGTTVQEVLDAADIATANTALRFNGREVTLDTNLSTNGDLMVSKAIKGA